MRGRSHAYPGMIGASLSSVPASLSFRNDSIQNALSAKFFGCFLRLVILQLLNGVSDLLSLYLEAAAYGQKFQGRAVLNPPGYINSPFATQLFASIAARFLGAISVPQSRPPFFPRPCTGV